MTESNSFINFQAKLINEYISTVISAGVPYALLDFPYHQNVGDSTIWLGEIKILKKVVGVKPRYVCDYYNYRESDLRTNHPEGPILIHGGAISETSGPNITASVSESSRLSRIARSFSCHRR